MKGWPSTSDEIRAAKQLKALSQKDYTASGVIISITNTEGANLVDRFTIRGEDMNQFVANAIEAHMQHLLARKETLDSELDAIKEITGDYYVNKF